MEGLGARAGSSDFSTGSQRETASLRRSIKSLEEKGYIVCESDSVYGITDDGYARADRKSLALLDSSGPKLRRAGRRTFASRGEIREHDHAQER